MKGAIVMQLVEQDGTCGNRGIVMFCSQFGFDLSCYDTIIERLLYQYQDQYHNRQKHTHHGYNLTPPPLSCRESRSPEKSRRWYWLLRAIKKKTRRVHCSAISTPSRFSSSCMQAVNKRIVRTQACIFQNSFVADEKRHRNR